MPAPKAAQDAVESVGSLTMSLLPPRGFRLWRIRVLVIAALICCALFVVYFWWSNRSEDRKADEEIVKYLSLVQEGDRTRADAMLCGGDDTSGVRFEDKPYGDTWEFPRIESFVIVGTRDWSSIIDGHGRAYRIRLTFTNGTAAIGWFAVEVIGNDPCIGTQYPLYPS